jgi:hypothetical protein
MEDEGRYPEENRDRAHGAHVPILTGIRTASDGRSPRFRRIVPASAAPANPSAVQRPPRATAISKAHRPPLPAGRGPRLGHSDEDRSVS